MNIRRQKQEDSKGKNYKGKLFKKLEKLIEELQESEIAISRENNTSLHVFQRNDKIISNEINFVIHTEKML